MARQEIGFTYTSKETGKRNVKVIDRINIDDLYLHMIQKEIYRLLTGKDQGSEVSKDFTDFLLRENYITR